MRQAAVRAAGARAAGARAAGVIPAALLARRVRDDGATPFLTWYDDATGERVELSAVSLANAVAKIAHLLAGDLAVEPGELVGVRLPAHWQTASVLLGLWSVGAVADLDGGAARVQVVAEAWLAEPGVDAAEDVLALSLRPMGGRLAVAPPPGVLDYALEVPPQPDVWSGASVAGEAPALVLAGQTSTGADLGDTAGLPPGARVLALADWTTLAGLRAGLVAPLAVGGSVVLVANPEESLLAARAKQEMATHAAGLVVAGLPSVPVLPEVAPCGGEVAP